VPRWASKCPTKHVASGSVCHPRLLARADVKVRPFGRPAEPAPLSGARLSADLHKKAHSTPGRARMGLREFFAPLAIVPMRGTPEPNSGKVSHEGC
jgi:hypothetical protein